MRRALPLLFALLALGCGEDASRPTIDRALAAVIAEQDVRAVPIGRDPSG